MKRTKRAEAAQAQRSTTEPCATCVGLGYRIAVEYVRYYGARYRHEWREPCPVCSVTSPTTAERQAA